LETNEPAIDLQISLANGTCPHARLTTSEN